MQWQNYYHFLVCVYAVLSFTTVCKEQPKLQFLTDKEKRYNIMS